MSSSACDVSSIQSRPTKVKHKLNPGASPVTKSARVFLTHLMLHPPFGFLQSWSVVATVWSVMLVWYQEVGHSQRFYTWSTGAPVRTHLRWQSDDRVERLLRESGFISRLGGDQQLISGLLHFEVGDAWEGVLSTWNWQAKYVWDYFLRPLDSVALLVVDAVKLEVPLDVASCSGQDGNVAPVHRPGRARQAWAFCPLLPEEVGSCRLIGGQTVGDWVRGKGYDVGDDSAEGFERIPCMRIVDALAHLIRHGRWQWLIGLTRWHALAPFIGHHLCPMGPAHEGPDDIAGCQLTPERMEDLASRLRSWAPIILASPAGDDERQALVAAVRFADTCAVGLRGRFRLDVHGSKFLYTSSLLLEVLRMCRHVKGGRGSIESVLQRAVNVVFPMLLQSTVAHMFSSKKVGHLIVPCKATRHRGRLSLDAALILLHRERLATRRCLRFGWADSSSQLSRDWLLSAHDSMLESDLLRAAEAADGLVAARFRREALTEAPEERDDAGSDVESGTDDTNEQAEFHNFLLHAIRRHDHLPAAMGKVQLSWQTRCLH